MIEKIVTDTIFEVLRQKLVSTGYLPDIKAIANYDSDDVDIALVVQETYKTQKEAVVTAKGFCIDLFGYSSSQAKGEKKSPRIVINIHQFLPGNLGNQPSPFYELSEDGIYYIKKKPYSLLSNLTFTIYAVGSKADHMYKMNEIIMSAIPYRDYLKPIEEEELLPYNNFFCVLKDKGKTEELPEGLMERYFIYEIPDLQEIPALIIPGDIPPILEIDLDIP